MRVDTPFEQYIALLRIRYTAAQRNRRFALVGTCIITILIIVDLYLIGERNASPSLSSIFPLFVLLLSAMSNMIYVQVDCTLLKTLLEFAEAFHASETTHNDEL